MKISQIYELVNAAAKQSIGDTAVLQEDLSNLVDVGVAITDSGNYNKFVSALVDHIGKVVYVNRPYSGRAPSVLMDGWEYGSILEKISSEMPEAVVNETWELTDGTSYDPNVYHGIQAEAKFFNSRTTFEIERSIMDRQLKSAFSNSGQMNGFLSMLQNEVDKALTIRNDQLIMATIDNAIGETMYNAYPSGAYTGAGNNRAINLLYDYNQQFGTSLEAEDAKTTPEFLRYASFRIGLMLDRIAGMSRLFNIGGKARFTPRDRLHVVMLSEFRQAAGVYLYDAANQFNRENITLPNAETVPFWQGSGTSFAFADTSKINIKTPTGHEVSAGGILCVMFDRDALGVANFDSRVTTNYNPKAEFTNYFYKRDAQYFNDYNENCVVFFIA